MLLIYSEKVMVRPRLWGPKRKVRRNRTLQLFHLRIELLFQTLQVFFMFITDPIAF